MPVEWREGVIKVTNEENALSLVASRSSWQLSHGSPLRHVVSQGNHCEECVVSPNMEGN